MPDSKDRSTKSRVAPNPALKFWREMGQEMIKESIKATEEAGKQIITVAGILEGLYFHAIAFSDLRTGSGLVWWQITSYLLPIVLWLVSLWFAASIFLPREYKINISSSDTCKQTYEEIAEYKLSRFRIAIVLLGLGMAGLLPPIVLYLSN